MGKGIPFARPERGLMPRAASASKLTQFFEMRRALYHCADLMKEMESCHDPETIAPLFSRACNRLALSADCFSGPGPTKLAEKGGLDEDHY